MIERTIGIHQDLPALAADLFKFRHKLLEIGGAGRSSSRFRGRLDELFIQTECTGMIDRNKVRVVPRPGGPLGTLRCAFSHDRAAGRHKAIFPLSTPPYPGNIENSREGRQGKFRPYRCENSATPGTSICALSTVPVSLSVM